MVNIFGNHYFECKYHSKQWLHNKCRDIIKSWFERIAPLAGIVQSSTAISTKLASLSHQFPFVQPLDIGVYTLSGMVGIDVTITAMPGLASTASEQEAAILSLPTSHK
eukprot:15338984-Ditylum_brightwellii.AAC.2